jgi:hypothetical protein
MDRNQNRLWVHARPVKARTVLQLKVTLVGSKPPIWRRLLIRDDATLDDLHRALQIAFGWTESHLHRFDLGGHRYQPRPRAGSDPAPEAGVADSTKVRLAELDLTPEGGLRYTYDFGDNWEHTIQVENLLDAAAAEAAIARVTGARVAASDQTPVARCLAGARAGPIEDCGGVEEFEELITILADPKHPDHRDRREWVEDLASGRGGFDPQRFEVKPVNAGLAKHLDR